MKKTDTKFALCVRLTNPISIWLYQHTEIYLLGLIYVHKSK